MDLLLIGSAKFSKIDLKFKHTLSLKSDSLLKLNVLIISPLF